MATVFTNAPIVVIASTLIDFACTLFYFILLLYIQLYSTAANELMQQCSYAANAANAAFNAAAILQSLLCYSPVVYQ